MNLPKWLEYLERLHPSTIELGLDRINKVASKLPIDFSGIRVITVGGTNGKGSTVTMLSAILEAAGMRTACYTSPHILQYNERVRLGDRYATDEELCESFAKVEAERGDIQLTYFEFGTLAALQLFSDYAPNVAILEVGLGGRLDAVNILDSDIAIVTNVDLDHTDWLGDTREAIGFEKAGIYRTGKPALYGEKDMPASVLEQVTRIGASLYANGKEYEATDNGDGTWCWRGIDTAGKTITYTALPFNDYPLDNCAVTVQAIRLLTPEVTTDQIVKGLNHAMLPGRFQVFDRGYPLVLDVGHNPHAARRVAELVSVRFPNHQVSVVIAMLADKDYRGVLSVYRSLRPRWYVAGIHEERGLQGKMLYNCLSDSGEADVHCFTTAAEAFTAADEACKALAADTDKQQENAPVLLVTGSFFTVAAVMELL